MAIAYLIKTVGMYWSDVVLSLQPNHNFFMPLRTHLSAPVKNVAVSVVVVAGHSRLGHEVRKFLQLKRADAWTVGF